MNMSAGTVTVPPPGGQHTSPVFAYALHGNCYINLTNQCTLRCRFCPRFSNDWEVQGYNLRLKREPGVEKILEAIGDPRGYREVVFCGLGEPTLRLPVMLNIAEVLKANGAHVRVNTDGLASRRCGWDVTPKFQGKVDCLSISLNAQDEATYNRHCRPLLPDSYEALLKFITQAKKYVPDVTVTAIDGLEGVDIAACGRIADDLGVRFRSRMLDVVG